MTLYTRLKQRNADHGTCVRAGCTNQCLDDNLLCEPCAIDHRNRNKRSYLRLHAKKSRQLRWPWWSFVRNSNVEK